MCHPPRTPRLYLRFVGHSGSFVLYGVGGVGHDSGIVRPLIGISCCSKVFGPSNLPNHAASDACVRAVDKIAGAVPVLLPALGDDVDITTLLQRLDGILLTGSQSHVGPCHYGGRPHDDGTPEDRARDATTLPLIRAAIAHGTPILAICRGLQELNVALGGTLHQCLVTLPGRLDHYPKPAESGVAKAHRAQLHRGGVLHGLAGRTDIEVNSLHYQAIDRLAPGLVVEAEAPDGTIEAVRVANASFAIGLQWHPEFDFRTDPLSRSIFVKFGEAAREPRNHYLTKVA
jgi:putative glutamine amidotransferase